MKDCVSNSAIVVVSLVLSLLLVEILMRIFTPFPITYESNKVPHDPLGYTLAPALGDVDKNGFRNPFVKDEVDLVGIGDSHTYGTNVSWRHSWPHQLADRMGLDVYNFGVGSYTLYHYYHLLELSRKLNPEYVLVGLYPKNDVGFHTCKMFQLGYWRDLVQQTPLQNSHCKKYLDNPVFDSFTRLTDPDAYYTPNWDPRRSAFFNALDHLILKHLKTTYRYYFGSRNYTRVTLKNVTFLLDRKGSITRDLEAKHSLTRRSETGANTVWLLSRMQNLAEASGIKLGFLIIPSQERVIYSLLKEQNRRIPDPLAKSIRVEISNTRFLKQKFKDLGIQHESILDRMRRSVARAAQSGERVYVPGDGHPNERGYAVYAREGIKLLNRME